MLLAEAAPAFAKLLLFLAWAYFCHSVLTLRRPWKAAWSVQGSFPLDAFPTPFFSPSATVPARRFLFYNVLVMLLPVAVYRTWLHRLGPADLPGIYGDLVCSSLYVYAWQVFCFLREPPIGDLGRRRK